MEKNKNIETNQIKQNNINLFNLFLFNCFIKLPSAGNKKTVQGKNPINNTGI